jgi:hypothetical protein
MAEPYLAPPASTFVVRFWRLWSVAGAGWRGRIEHVQSGESHRFVNSDGLIDFIRSYGILTEEAEDASSGEKQDGCDTEVG